MGLHQTVVSVRNSLQGFAPLAGPATISNVSANTASQPTQAVAVIGGAVAGAQVARLLADHGVLVAVFEQNPRPLRQDRRWTAPLALRPPQQRVYEDSGAAGASQHPLRPVDEDRPRHRLQRPDRPVGLQRRRPREWRVARPAAADRGRPQVRRQGVGLPKPVHRLLSITPTTPTSTASDTRSATTPSSSEAGSLRSTSSKS